MSAVHSTSSPISNDPELRPPPSSEPSSPLEVARTASQHSSPSATNRSPKASLQHEAYDIEHVPVDDDPRKWSPLRKNMSLTLIASAAMIAGLAGSVQNPAVKEMELDLPATSTQFSLSVSLFVLVQGLFPLIWSALVYLASLSVFTIGSVVVGVSKSIELVIGFRCFQAAGSSAVHAIGAATLADIFEPAERGTKLAGDLLVPDRRFGDQLLAFLLFFRDTFRKERSLTYQNALTHRMVRGDLQSSTMPPSVPGKEEKTPVQLDTEKGGATPPPSVAVVPSEPIVLSLMDVSPVRPLVLVMKRMNNVITLSVSGLLFAFCFLIPYTSARTLSAHYNYDALKIGLVTLCFGFGNMAGSVLGGRWSDYQLRALKAKNGGISKPEVSYLPPFRDGFQKPMTYPQMRLHKAGTRLGHLCISLLLWLSVDDTGYGRWVYSSTLAYIVDANNGRSSTAVACNSAFRGVSAFIAIEIAVPMQDKLGDGWMYTIWAGIMALNGVFIFLASWKGGEWRERSEAQESKMNAS
ncbi:major facilitator superfamily domain-containing protein [Ephemerocybe angulata]|uniref:Major facilitator superfamily domain-containing protein n=1 Tax=Ephemerocybe angulata TaxID=980116 RepID=A0A8H6I562_9AGAR|nr:major facilitator superfamily domain-containing protein [Tulosesus angulatus]